MAKRKESRRQHEEHLAAVLDACSFAEELKTSHGAMSIKTICGPERQSPIAPLKIPPARPGR
ncbi:hypothetical protein [Xanthobacter sediminis]